MFWLFSGKVLMYEYQRFENDSLFNKEASGETLRLE